MSLLGDIRAGASRAGRAALSGVAHSIEGFLGDDALIKATAAATSDLNTPTGKPPRQSAWDLDPTDISAMMSEQMQGPSHPGTVGLDYGTFRAMATYSIISMIIDTRINQMAEYCVPKLNPHRVGMEIVMRDKSAKMTRAAEKQRNELLRFLHTCGDTRVQVRGNANFEVFMRKVMRDSLTFDQANFEIVHTNGGKPAGMIAVDAATIRRAQFTAEELKLGHRLPDETAYVQLVNNRVVARFDPEELCFGIRRPRTDMRFNGYGYPELETLVRTLTNLLNTETYNASNFTNGMHTSGIIAIKSAMSPQLFRAFRREFYAMMSGAANAKKTPLIQLDPEAKEEISNVNLSNNNKEMEFSQWQAFLIKIAHGVFQMDPAENGFLYGNEGQTGSLSQSGPSDRIVAGRERGLYPTLRCAERWINDHFIMPLHEDFMLSFGVDVESEKDKLDMLVTKGSKFMTVNEIRAEADLKPLPAITAETSPADWGPLDPTFINAVEQWMASQQQQGQPGADGQMPSDGSDGQDDGAGDQGNADGQDDGSDTSGLYGQPEQTAKSFGRGRRKLRIEV